MPPVAFSPGLSTPTTPKQHFRTLITTSFRFSFSGRLINKFLKFVFFLFIYRFFREKRWQSKQNINIFCEWMRTVALVARYYCTKGSTAFFETASIGDSHIEHYCPILGHFRYAKTIGRLKQNYWPSVRQNNYSCCKKFTNFSKYKDRRFKPLWFS